ELVLRADHADQRAGGEEDAVDDVAEALIAEIGYVFAVAAVRHHAHAPLAGHLADLEEAGAGADLREEMAEVESLGPEAVALGSFGQPVAAEVRGDVAGDLARDDVERGLDLDAAAFADLDDLRRQPQPM